MHLILCNKPQLIKMVILGTNGAINKVFCDDGLTFDPNPQDTVSYLIPLQNLLRTLTNVATNVLGCSSNVEYSDCHRAVGNNLQG